MALSLLVPMNWDLGTRRCMDIVIYRDAASVESATATVPPRSGYRRLVLRREGMMTWPSQKLMQGRWEWELSGNSNKRSWPPTVLGGSGGVNSSKGRDRMTEELSISNRA
ncbi:hypothetical protein AXG93_4492s1120 [Marchantia polymorpha subsp. ruderalis]|uniref:Uncharacterized protein n=1 Tax=Marchantia polymorpha subsp. ruderalis TaxID=1480154 RepID=A0A176W6I6_MARPO|nr:hypothetical protein AXG93_4492s1120 [Marchantia polymorpha subsp. ruderalis]